MSSAAAAPILAMAIFASLGMAGCENGVQNMYDQPKDKPLTASPLWPDGRASRPQVPDTLAYSQGTLADTSSGRKGLVADEPSEAVYTSASLARGRERFGIYCAPCHGPVGDGNGYVALRGFPHPPTYHSERLRGVSDAYLFDVISNGHGVMYPFKERIPAVDRWTIVAYIRALQLSQHASMADVPEGERGKLVPPAQGTVP